jgi:transcriptional regulator with XRE-family HTH domain
MANGSRQAAWEFFGTELRRHREEVGMTQAELGSRVFVSGAYIGQFEQAFRKPQLDISQRIDEILQTDGIFERLCRKLIDDKRYADYFAQAAELEGLATSVWDFEPTVVPGLLQTPAYARALVLATHPLATDELIDDRVAARMERSQLLKDATRPMYCVVVHETVLRVPVGGPAQADGVRRCSADRLYRDVVFGEPPRRPGSGEAGTPSLRSTQGRRAVAEGVPRPDPIGG